MRKNRNDWSRERTCSECGKVESVRKDNVSIRCLSCAARERQQKGRETRREKASLRATFCPVCQKKKAEVDAYCSVSCRMADKRVVRKCIQCDAEFHVLKSSLTGKTNASGNFCCRPCYEKWLCQTDRVNGRGSQWRKQRNEVLRKTPFCAVCGTSRKEKLQVHHIVPFRLCHQNDPANLIPLCIKCHKTVETIVHGIERADGSQRRMFLFFASWLRERQLMTAITLKELLNANSISQS